MSEGLACAAVPSRELELCYGQQEGRGAQISPFDLQSQVLSQTNTLSLTSVSHQEVLAFPQHSSNRSSSLPSAKLKPLRISTRSH